MHCGVHEDGMMLLHSSTAALRMGSPTAVMSGCRAAAWHLSAAATLIEMKLAPDSLATALASSVLPQPAPTPLVHEHHDSRYRVCTTHACVKLECTHLTRPMLTREIVICTWWTVQQHPCSGGEAHGGEALRVLDRLADGKRQLLPDLVISPAS